MNMAYVRTREGELKIEGIVYSTEPRLAPLSTIVRAYLQTGELLLVERVDLGVQKAHVTMDQRPKRRSTTLEG